MIYAIEAVGARSVKVGVAEDVERRMAALQCGSPFPLRVVGECVGDFYEETLLHKIFARSSLFNEWFHESILPEFHRLTASSDVRRALEVRWDEIVQAAVDKQLSDIDARRLLAVGLGSVCTELGPRRVSRAVGCDEKTIRRARDEESTLNLACTFNLLDVDPHALDALAAAKGVMIVPLMMAAPDIVPSAGAAIHRIGMNRDPNSPGGAEETDAELIATEAENDALLAACLERRSRIALAKLRRSEMAA